jgi:hypothetical protein
MRRTRDGAAEESEEPQMSFFLIALVLATLVGLARSRSLES